MDWSQRSFGMGGGSFYKNCFKRRCKVIEPLATCNKLPFATNPKNPRIPQIHRYENIRNMISSQPYLIHPFIYAQRIYDQSNQIQNQAKRTNKTKSKGDPKTTHPFIILEKPS